MYDCSVFEAKEEEVRVANALLGAVVGLEMASHSQVKKLMLSTKELVRGPFGRKEGSKFVKGHSGMTSIALMDGQFAAGVK